MDILDRLGTVWPENYALQPNNSDERKTVIEIQQLKTDAFSEIVKLRAQLAQPTPSQSVDERAEFEKAMSARFGWNNTKHILENPEEYSEMVFAHTFYAHVGWQARAQLVKSQPTSQKKCEKNMDLLRENYKAIYALFGNDGSVITPIDTKTQPTSQDVVDAERYRWLANNCDGNAQDDFIQWLSTVVATRADIDESIDAAMIERE